LFYFIYLISISFPPYLLDELVKLHGSKDKLLTRLRKLITMSSNFQPGSYGQEIHEMTEARAFGMGQYAHNNQPVSNTAVNGLAFV
jgi:hypothetical protein